MRILFTVIFLQVLHIGGVETSRVLGVVDVLIESGETICFVRQTAITSAIDKFCMHHESCCGRSSTPLKDPHGSFRLDILAGAGVVVVGAD